MGGMWRDDDDLMPHSITSPPLTVCQPPPVSEFNNTTLALAPLNNWIDQAKIKGGRESGIIHQDWEPTH